MVGSRCTRCRSCPIVSPAFSPLRPGGHRRSGIPIRRVFSCKWASWFPHCLYWMIWIVHTSLSNADFSTGLTGNQYYCTMLFGVMFIIQNLQIFHSLNSREKRTLWKEIIQNISQPHMTGISSIDQIGMAFVLITLSTRYIFIQSGSILLCVLIFVKSTTGCRT